MWLEHLASGALWGFGVSFAIGFLLAVFDSLTRGSKIQNLPSEPVTYTVDEPGGRWPRRGSIMS
jgi:hypothetical protein